MNTQGNIFLQLPGGWRGGSATNALVAGIGVSTAQLQNIRHNHIMYIQPRPAYLSESPRSGFSAMPSKRHLIVHTYVCTLIWYMP